MQSVLLLPKVFRIHLRIKLLLKQDVSISKGYLGAEPSSFLQLLLCHPFSDTGKAHHPNSTSKGVQCFSASLWADVSVLGKDMIRSSSAPKTIAWSCRHPSVTSRLLWFSSDVQNTSGGDWDCLLKRAHRLPCHGPCISGGFPSTHNKISSRDIIKPNFLLASVPNGPDGN